MLGIKQQVLFVLLLRWNSLLFMFCSTGMHQHLLQWRWTVSSRFGWYPLSRMCAYWSTGRIKHKGGTKLRGNITTFCCLHSVSGHSENSHKAQSWCRRRRCSSIIKTWTLV